MGVTTADPAARPADDSTLVARCLAGQDAAWQQLVSRYSGLVAAVIRRYHLPAEDQADVFQDVWVELWRALPSLRSHDRLGSWLATIAGRRAWDTKRRLPRHVDGEPAEQLFGGLADQGESAEQQVTRRETCDDVREALARVSSRCRVLVRALFYDESSSYVDIAGRLGCSPNSVGPIRGRCFKEIRAALDALRSERERASERRT
jgi:RNA polymerase sigma factor (sigma-70 family)